MDMLADKHQHDHDGQRTVRVWWMNPVGGVRRPSSTQERAAVEATKATTTHQVPAMRRLPYLWCSVIHRMTKAKLDTASVAAPRCVTLCLSLSVSYQR
jgi:hypothetical protein